ncbi:hypothetical protein Lal_00037770 [Lupinus albus]|nr:hypothetical protein Lal_00037770 [Lupinus albus]
MYLKQRSCEVKMLDISYMGGDPLTPRVSENNLLHILAIISWKIQWFRCTHQLKPLDFPRMNDYDVEWVSSTYSWSMWIFSHHIYFSHVNVPIPISMTFQAYQKTISYIAYIYQDQYSIMDNYVTILRIKSKKELKILIHDKDGQSLESTTNVGYEEVFQNLKLVFYNLS